MKITHTRLVKIARRWLLSKGYPVVISEMTTSREVPDAIGFKPGGYSCVIEVKVSRSDFFNDIRKSVRRNNESKIEILLNELHHNHRMGFGMGDQRFYLAPIDLIQKNEAPKCWGLLIWDGRKVRQLHESKYFEKDFREELNLFVSCIRRVHGPIQGTSIKHYEYTTKSRAVLITHDTPTRDDLLEK